MKQMVILLAALVLVASANAQEESVAAGTATLVVGEVTFTEEGGGPTVLETGKVLIVDSIVTTGPDSRAVILTSRQSAIRIGPNSTIVLDEMKAAGADGEKAKVQVNLRSGSLGALIESKEFGAMDFSVKTPHGVAAARGTFYAVAVTEEKSYTQVKEGTVEVKTEGNSEPDPDKDELGRAIPPKQSGE